MDTFQVAEWAPMFSPKPNPAHWIALVATSAGISILSDRVLTEGERSWLADWLNLYRPRRPKEEASYVYLGLSSDWCGVRADGKVSSRGVTGFGYGEDFGEPPRAILSTVSKIVIEGIEALTR